MWLVNLTLVHIIMSQRIYTALSSNLSFFGRDIGLKCNHTLKIAGVR